MTRTKLDISPDGEAVTILIDNQWRAAAGGGAVAVHAPSDDGAFAQIARGGAAEVDEAVAAARHAFEEGEWGRLTAIERGRLLMRVGELIQANAEELAQLESRDTGKPLSQGRADMVAAARYFEYYGSAADKVHGETIPFLDGYTVMALREPFGVTGHIIPWNYPAQMFGRSLAPSLAMGNATVLKPAEEACLLPLRIADLAIEAGFPPGAINVVTGLGEEAGAPLASHPDIDFLAFTGSPEVGTLVQQAAARNHVGCVLELGGKSPQIVFDDADFDAVLPVVQKAIVQNAGQTCSAGSRVLVQESVFDAFIERLTAAFGELVTASHDADANCGPLVSRAQQQRVQRMLADAEADGVPVIARGRIAEGTPEQGYYVAPTLLGPVPREHTIAREEVFGPVLCAIPFRDEADAVALANGTDYGLVAGIWTRDGARQMRMARRVRAGQVFVNGYGAGGGIELPFGGMKKSGHGREKGFEALREFSVVKTVVLNHG
ncbi:NADP/NAD-dependent aldehyde dehydrogenase PuuC [wastewater metagenome]|uniref:NADP/NAD-dependent aldehyde dehydrogenase PuuC n=4 Tax=root TaxID=1 RepID=A0A5B8RII4_9ZZZZ|nr:aldehyde dehydrogenase family protein [Arhodomonas aquaeolei]MCS4504787.1 aldehyde dehydrogenase family protein [Arhodomonas aquaeolei]QEA07374.1 NADP/NAD-dependent aldehyde dehydrogenase PuuC [uncultured organism]